MKRFILLLSVFMVFFTSNCFAYSFTEYPSIPSDQLYKGAHIIFKYNNDTYFASFETFSVFPIDICINSFYFGCDNSDYTGNGSVKYFKLDGDNWFYYGDYFAIEVFLTSEQTGLDVNYGGVTDFQILCSDVYLWFSSNYFIGSNQFLANAKYPLINYEELQLQEMQKVNTEIVKTNNIINFISNGLVFAIALGIVVAILFLLYRYISNWLYY